MSEQIASSGVRKRRIVWLLLLLSLIPALLILAPYAIGYGLKQAIQQQGGEDIQIGNVDFNPFTATLKLEQVRVKRGDTQTLELPELDLELAWAPLFRKQVVVVGLRLSGLNMLLTSDVSGNQLRVGGMSFDLRPTETTEVASPWAVHLLRIELNQVHLDVDWQGKQAQLAIENLRLQDFRSDVPDQPAQLNLKAALSQAELELDGVIAPNSNTQNFAGEVALAQLPLTKLMPWLPAGVPEMKGLLSLQGTVEIGQDETGVLFSHQGGFGLQTLALNLDDGNSLGVDGLQWKGGFSVNTGDAVGFEIKGDLKADQLVATQQSQALAADQINLQFEKLTVTGSGAETKIDWIGGLHSKALRFTKPDQITEENASAYQAAELQWRGRLAARTGAPLEVQAEGQLTAAEILADQEQASIQAGQLNMQFKHLVSTVVGQQISLDWQGGMDASKLQATVDEQELGVSGVDWNGAASLNLGNTGATYQLEGQLNGRGMHLERANTGLQLTHAILGWDGQLSLTQDAEASHFLPTGVLQIEGVELTDSRDVRSLISVASLQLDAKAEAGAEIKLDQLALNRIRLADITATDSGELSDMLSLSALRLYDISFAKASGLAIKKAELDALQQKLVRGSDKRMNLNLLVDRLSEMAAGKGQDDGPQAESMPIKIGEVELTGNSAVSFTDQSVQPIYQARLRPEQLRISGIDSTQPKQASVFKLKGVVDDNSKLDISGDLYPFAAKPGYRLAGSLNGFALPPLSSYTTSLMGYELLSGKANSEFKLQSEQDKLEGNIDLVLNQLEVKPLSKEKMAQLQQQLDIPLETALGMLKDKNNQIKLTLPVSGDADNVDIDPSDAINQAIGRAMKRGAKTYLATALFPFGTLLTLVEMAGDAAAKMKLDPVIFTPGNHELSAEHRVYLKKVAQVLMDRQEIHMRICGVSVEGDRESVRQQLKAEREKKKLSDVAVDVETQLQERLLELAQTRAKEIERFLVEQQVAADRLISCQPQFEAEQADSMPRADLLI